MVAYIVTNKCHYRATVDEAGQSGMQRLEIGDLIENLTLAELRAFPDRFTPVGGPQLEAARARQAALVQAREDEPKRREEAVAALAGVEAGALAQQISVLQGQLAQAQALASQPAPPEQRLVLAIPPTTPDEAAPDEGEASPPARRKR